MRTFEIGGRRVERRSPVRKLDWDSMRVNFFFIASPGVLEDFPDLITSFHLPPRHDFTTKLVGEFPNLTVIDTAAVIAQVQSMTDKLIVIVQFVFGFAVLAGLVVLYAALQSTHDERDYELAMLRTLGARNRQCARPCSPSSWCWVGSPACSRAWARARSAGCWPSRSSACLRAGAGAGAGGAWCWRGWPAWLPVAGWARVRC